MFNKFKQNPPEIESELTIEQATKRIQNIEDLNTKYPGWDESIKYAKAGKPGYNEIVHQMLIKIMTDFNIKVADMTIEEAAYEIYKYLWGLDLIEDLYRTPDVDEIRINNFKQVYYHQKGKGKRSTIVFKDGQHIDKIVGKLLEHDRTNFDESHPGCESGLLDGSRITALKYPIVRETCIVIRKHGTFNITDENYIASGTLNKEILVLLSTLVKGRANIMICGDTNVGKTTLLRWLVKFLHPRLRIVTIETDFELFLNEWYQDRDILSLEAHPEADGWDIKRCIAAALHLSPDVLMVGEARGIGEAGQMINACRSGHPGSMGTVHALSADEAIGVLAQLAMEEGRTLPLPIIEGQVASAFNIIIQMYGNSITGTKKIERIVEVQNSNQGPVLKDLCQWVPSENNYEIGDWVFPNTISESLAKRLFKYGVSRSDIALLNQLHNSQTAAS